MPMQASRPTHKIVYTIIEREDPDPNIWRRAGTAFVNKDGSLNVYLDSLPLNGQLHIRDPREDKRDSNGDAT